MDAGICCSTSNSPCSMSAGTSKLQGEQPTSHSSTLECPRLSCPKDPNGRSCFPAAQAVWEVRTATPQIQLSLCIHASLAGSLTWLPMLLSSAYGPTQAALVPQGRRDGASTCHGSRHHGTRITVTQRVTPPGLADSRAKAGAWL